MFYQDAFSPSLHRQLSSPLAAGPEPMVMGSPSSPSISGPPHSSYLPGYLLGDHPSAGAQSPSHTRLWSSSTAASHSPSGKISGSNTSLQSPLLHQLSQQKVPDVTMSAHRTKSKSAAPPVRGLLESSFTNTSLHETPTDVKPRFGATFSTPLGPPRHGSDSVDGLNRVSHSTPTVPVSNNSILSFNFNPNQTISPPQVDPFYTQGESLTPDDILDETWITVFGFPTGAVGYILSQFAQYGVIVRHEISNDGNWMHIHYQTRLQAKKALSKNGKIIGNNIMVGVQACIDKKVMGVVSPSREDHSRREEIFNSFNTSTIGQQAQKPGTPIRPLTAAYKASAAERQVEADNSILQKEEGFVSKAMEYLFGW